MYDICWMNWPQAKEPFSEETLEFIAAMDITKDLYIIKQFVNNDRCLKNVRVSSLLLKKGAAAGLTLFEIGSLIYRKNEQPSVIEKIIKQAGSNFTRLKTKVPDDANCSTDTQDTSRECTPITRSSSMPFSQRQGRGAFDAKLFESFERYIDQAIQSTFLNRAFGILRLKKSPVDSK